MTIRVLVADDQGMVRSGFSILLNAQPDIEVVGEAVNGQEAVARVAELRPDVILMDVRMPVMDGLQATRQIAGRQPGVRVVVLTAFSDDESVFAAVQAGARGYLLKGNVHTDLLETIRAVHAGRKRIPPEVAAELAMHTAEDQLTARELEVLNLIAQGNANKEIAAQLSVREDTVKSHVGNILEKLGANDRTHAVTIGLQRGIIEL